MLLVAGHARTWNDQVWIEKRFRAMAAKFQRDTRLFQLGKARSANFAFTARIRRDYARPASHTKKRRGYAGPRQPHDQHAFPPQLDCPWHRSFPSLSGSQYPLPQFQRGQRKQREDQRRDPKTHDDFRLAPSQQFKMMMDGGHSKNTLASELEGTDLQDHRERLDNKDSANEKQENLLFDDDRNRAQRSTERKRAYVSHENFRGVRVVPQETKRRAHQRSAKYRQFADPRDVLNLEVRSPARVAAHIG